ncbi:MAG: bacteriocin immunity protein [Liquorilactobacillus nagelii]|jgi:hypothetical protein|uniref:Bacteriocin immunity protein n=1 Tax=Liquorilactobacillus nagelii TaxID=82688 RepID=A0A3S6QYM2_9LACO|nr:bacteriocin immunity protein [Liquorilactobacillus nagelii]AUJ33198.1 bacteriocin immunity protein [Liquorilactobacillus nagelii]MCC7615176.1 bacteriocin immunity protein [Liquorilactobacillus nagelii]MCI1632676.1 bacteriocin immunity protein [Liquorilactobacillus nagelii]MCI1921719.1 bacteriocin immunity protein [Liquorilactobacillus nagelii]MCI1976249.1 bacteriocin immunity protein [Liquorilactobacillus nagelii]
MKKQAAVEQMLNQLSQAYAACEIKEQPEAQQLIFSAAQELEKNGDCDLVASKLCKKIVLYYWEHKDNFPQALADLHGQIKSKAVKYDATAISAIMLPMWF